MAKHELDCMHEACPIPLLKALKKLNTMTYFNKRKFFKPAQADNILQLSVFICFIRACYPLIETAPF